MKLRRCHECSAPILPGEHRLCGECEVQRFARWALSVGAIVAACALAAFTSCEGRAHGQDAPAHALTVRDRDDVARCLVAERSAHHEDDAAILTVLSRRAVRFHGSVGETARHYCAALRTVHPSQRQRDILALPGGPAARRYAAAWASAQASIAAWQSGDLRHGCSETPDEWGDRLHDAQRARRAGWVAVDCGRTANMMWRHRAVRADLARGGR